MSSYQTAQRWMDAMDVKAYAGAGFFVLCIVASAVFGVLPHGSLIYINALVSGAAWMVCLGILIFGGKRVDLYDTVTAALLAGGLTTSIPSLFANDSVVVWGSTFSRLGVLMFALRWAWNIYSRVRNERDAEK